LRFLGRPFDQFDNLVGAGPPERFFGIGSGFVVDIQGYNLQPFSTGLLGVGKDFGMNKYLAIGITFDGLRQSQSRVPGEATDFKNCTALASSTLNSFGEPLETSLDAIHLRNKHNELCLCPTWLT
jgi:hypothetical protein